MMKNLLLATVVAMTAAGSAMAVTTVTSTAGPDVLPANQVVIYDFNGASPAALTGTGAIVSGFVSGEYAPPLGDLTPYLKTGAFESSTLTLDTSVKVLSFYWGSMDPFNAVAFFDDGGELISGYFGNQIPLAPANGSIPNSENNRRVTFDFGTQTAKYVTFNTDVNAFEIDDFAIGAVPEPATWGLMIAGFAMTGVSLRRRKSVVTA